MSELREKIADAVLAHWRHMPVKGVTADWIYGATDAILSLMREEGVDLEGWRPIDDEAKDGSLVELAWLNWDKGVRVSRWLKSRNQWAWEGNKPYQLTVGQPQFYRKLPPLPIAPEPRP